MGSTVFLDKKISAHRIALREHWFNIFLMCAILSQESGSAGSVPCPSSKGLWKGV